MALARCILLVVSSLSMLRGGIVRGADAESPRTDLYGDPLPPGAVMRLGTIRLQHAKADVVFSKDGKQLISCGTDGEVRVWDSSSGKQVRRTRLWKPSERKGIVYTALAPGGAVTMAEDEKATYLYDTRTGKQLDRVAGAGWLGFSPDGKILALRWRNNNGWGPARLWDITEFKKHLELEVPPHTVLTRAAFAPNGKEVAGLGGERGGEELFLWDMVTGKLLKRKKFRIPMHSLAYSPGGTTLAAGLEGRAGAVLLDAASWKERAALSVPADIQGREFTDLVVFSPDGRLLAGSYGDTRNSSKPGILLWDLTRPKRAERLPTQDFIRAIAFAPDGKTLIYHEGPGMEIHLWNIALGRQIQHRPGHDTLVSTLAVSADGQMIASGDLRNQLLLWNAATGAPLRALQIADERTEICLFSSDGKRVVTASNTFQVWDIATGKELRRINLDRHEGIPPSLHAAAISADEKWLTALVGDALSRPGLGRLVIWDLATGKKQMQRPYSGRIMKPAPSSNVVELFRHAALSPNGECVTVKLGDRIGIEETATGTLLATLPQGVGESIQFAPDGRLVSAVLERPKLPRGGGKYLSLIEAASGEEVIRLEIEDCAQTVFTPDGCAVVVADRKQLRVWDVLTGERLREMAWPQEVLDGSGTAKVWSLVALPDGRAATGMTEGDILLWDLAQAKWPRHRPVPDLGCKEFDALWSDLAGNAHRGYCAIHKLTSSPMQAVSFLKDHLQPVAVDTKRIGKLLADLDSDSFEKREAASRELVRMRYRTDLLLRRALENRASLEMRRRLESILAEPKRPPAEALRMLRAITVLERIGTPEAQCILEKLAGGAAAPETHAAQAALRRLNHRDNSTNGRSAESSNGNNP